MKHHHDTTNPQRVRAAFGPRGPRGHRGAGRGFGPGFGGPGFGGPGFGPGFASGHGPHGGGRGARARKGDVRAAILSLLAENPASGYGLMKAIAERTNDAWRPSPGSVYPTLSQLVDEQLIEATDPNAARSDFALTEAGRSYVAEHAEQIAAAWNVTSPESNELRESAMKLFGALRQFGVTANAEQRDRAVQKVDQLRKELYAILGE